MDTRILVVLAAMLAAAGAQMCDSQTITRNLALGKPAYQSSTYGNRHHAFLAVDGSTTTHEAYYSCAFTNNDKYAWWSVDLGSSQTVAEVYITGRADCCGDRLKDFYIGVTDTLPTTVAPTPTPLNYDLCHRYAAQVPQGARERIICDSHVRGRYLIVQLTGQNYLTLCVVEVYADSFLYDNNLALGRPTQQSSVYDSQTSKFAVDGYWAVWTFTAPQECTHTDYNKDPGPWWSVDLGRSYAIGEVWLQNRQDCCSERLSDFYVGVTDDSPATVVPRPFPNPTYQVCKHWTGQQFNIATRARIVCDLIVTGQHVIVQLAYPEYLTLCEVEVYSADRKSQSGRVDLDSQ